MIWRYATSMALVLVTGAAGFAQADETQAAMQDGSYEVQVQLELPNVNMPAKKTATICVTGDADGGTHGLAVLSDNNPLAKCPASNIRQEGNTLTFDIVCLGANLARASATYTLEPRQFRGRIAMWMGGKNMTVTETQLGSRVGDCEASSEPHS